MGCIINLFDGLEGVGTEHSESPFAETALPLDILYLQRTPWKQEALLSRSEWRQW